jgi:RNA polymerase sigma-70 factor (ECF subfamily)
LLIFVEKLEQNEANIDDEMLWTSMRTGSTFAFEALYRRYFQTLFSYGKRITPDEDAVNDAIQDLFVNIWRGRQSLNQAISVKYYLFRSLRREIHKSQKQETVNGEDWETVTEDLLPTQISAETSFSINEETNIRTEQLNSWLSNLPPRQNEALVLRYYHNLDYPEIADMLGIKEQTARNLVQKALYILRKMAIYLIFIAFEINY